ncbi:unnamed protein product [Microthlaspi erraticum]|uniref:Uncharacterized protein n=1 Tax=Microthlaspi erraticum TaxID=1685480 RepID=A0A6D2KVR5_9BRAS|nr:unnamed protein product [Microthlaspi erraticum]
MRQRWTLATEDRTGSALARENRIRQRIGFGDGESEQATADRGDGESEQATADRTSPATADWITVGICATNGFRRRAQLSKKGLDF